MVQYKLKEYRKLKRIIIQVQVLDSETKSFFGYTENLHREGMLLTSEQKIPLGKEFHLELVYSRDNDEEITIPLRVRCVWNRSSDSHNLYNAGFEFIDLAPQQTRDIERLIDELTVLNLTVSTITSFISTY